MTEERTFAVLFASTILSARKLGVKPGGNIKIHGLDSKYAWVGSLQRQVDWTDGCIAVTNPEIEEIWPLVPVGTPVEIRP
jgi:murein L,D-transpeptidase YafK